MEDTLGGSADPARQVNVCRLDDGALHILVEADDSVQRMLGPFTERTAGVQPARRERPCLWGQGAAQLGWRADIHRPATLFDDLVGAGEN
jgi:hypothetical protein